MARWRARRTRQSLKELTVDGQVEGPPNPPVVEGGAVHLEAGVDPAGDGGVLAYVQLRYRFLELHHLVGVLRRAQHVHPLLAELGLMGGVISEEEGGPAIQPRAAQLRLAPAKPVGVAAHDHAVEGHQLPPHEGARAHHAPRLPHLVLGRVHQLLGHDEGVGIGQIVQEGHVGLLQRHPQGIFVHHFYLVDDLILGGAVI